MIKNLRFNSKSLKNNFEIYLHKLDFHKELNPLPCILHHIY